MPNSEKRGFSVGRGGLLDKHNWFKKALPADNLRHTTSRSHWGFRKENKGGREWIKFPRDVRSPMWGCRGTQVESGR